VATASGSSPLAIVVKGGAGLMACDYTSAKSFAQQLLQYREGNRSHSFNSYCNLVTFADFILHICVALTANLKAANKALAGEKASQQVANQALQTS
jgi:hypothetical protein